MSKTHCKTYVSFYRRMLREDRRSEPRVGERVPYVVVYGSPGLPLIQLVRRSVNIFDFYLFVNVTISFSRETDMLHDFIKLFASSKSLLTITFFVSRPHEVLQDPSLRLNASYYITKQILPPLNRVFLLIGLDVFTWYVTITSSSWIHVITYRTSSSFFACFIRVFLCLENAHEYLFVASVVVALTFT